MKQKTIFYFFLAIQSLMILSCEKDKDPSILNDPLVLESEFVSFSDHGFISVSNQEGTILYYRVGKDLRRTIELDIVNTDRIDLTYGFETDDYFHIKTYRNVPSGFLLKASFFECNNEFSPSSSGFKRVELEIQGISQFSKLITPFDYKDAIEVDEIENKITVRGTLTNPKDLIITVIKENNEYKSLYLRNEDWVDQNGSNFFRSVNIEEFTSAQIHEIRLGREDRWMVKAEIRTTEGRVVSLSKWSTYTDYQEGDKIELLLLPEIDLGLMRLDLTNGNSFRGYQYVKTMTEIPDEINFYDPDIGLVAVNNNTYEVEVSEEYNLSMVRYEYLENNWLSTWEIYQMEEGALLNTLPPLPGSFISGATILSNQISNPETFVAEIYKVPEEMELEERYHTTGIDVQLRCMEYSTRFIGKEF